jgi:hypothetical protein
VAAAGDVTSIERGAEVDEASSTTAVPPDVCTNVNRESPASPSKSSQNEELPPLLAQNPLASTASRASAPASAGEGPASAASDASGTGGPPLL